MDRFTGSCLWKRSTELSQQPSQQQQQQQQQQEEGEGTATAGRESLASMCAADGALFSYAGLAPTLSAECQMSYVPLRESWGCAMSQYLYHRLLVPSN
jgi:hypothetical protein